MKIINNIISSITRIKLPKKDSDSIKKLRTEKMCKEIHSKMYVKKYNDFFLNDRLNTFIPYFNFLEEKQMINENIGMFPRRLFNKYSPDKIDNNSFWKYLYNHFPLLCITENDSIDSIEEAKASNLRFASRMGAVGCLLSEIYSSIENVKVLEIGAGYGNLYDYLNKNEILFVDKEYYSIELEKKFDHKNCFITKGGGLPQELIKSDLEFDLVYCFNTMQHLSYKQKIAYYYGIYDKLKNGGKFIVGIHLETHDNQKNYGLFDEFGTKYIRFFNQFTPIDKFSNFYSDIEDAGFSNIEIVNIYDSYFVFKITK